ncbi:MAG: hypothetical protein GX637_06765 [Clostridiales bacterium]|nr:hypothetical protein [Clostridiales bacterium]
MDADVSVPGLPGQKNAFSKHILAYFSIGGGKKKVRNQAIAEKSVNREIEPKASFFRPNNRKLGPYRALAEHSGNVARRNPETSAVFIV